MTARSMFRIQALALCIASLGAPTSRLLAQGTPAAVPPGVAAAADDGLAQAIRDTIAARLAALELLAPKLRATGRAATHPDRAGADRQVTLLRQQLRALPEPEAAEAYANAAILRAIEARLASLAVARPLLAAERGATHPEVQAMAAEETQLQQRRAELRQARPATGAGGPR